MGGNTRFAVAVHMLALIFMNEGSESGSTSEKMARSVNTNPVVIRRITAMLKSAGLIEVRAGVGGASLLHGPEEVTLLDIYRAVAGEDELLFHTHQCPNERCYVGRCILEVLSPPLMEAQAAMEAKLTGYTLMDIIRSIAERNHIEIAERKEK